MATLKCIAPFCAISFTRFPSNLNLLTAHLEIMLAAHWLLVWQGKPWNEGLQHLCRRISAESVNLCLPFGLRDGILSIRACQVPFPALGTMGPSRTVMAWPRAKQHDVTNNLSGQGCFSCCSCP